MVWTGGRSVTGDISAARCIGPESLMREPAGGSL
jgi:hypothetical protein